MTDRDERLYRIRPRRSIELELTRRRFLELVAASAAVGGLSGCSQSPPEKILPYTRQPLDVTPGTSNAYATSFLIDGYATGLIAQTREGRPIKIEGNPDHPASLGATSAFHQAAVLQLYDPDRAASVAHEAKPASWDALFLALRASARGAGDSVRLLLEPTSSPLVHALLAEVKRRLPACRVTFYAPLRTSAGDFATSRLFGRALSPVYDLSRAGRVVALDADPLGSAYDLSLARGFAARRRPTKVSDTLSRLYAVEAAMSITGSVADHRLARPARRVAQLTAAIAGAFVRSVPGAAADAAVASSRLDPVERRWVDALVRDVRSQPRGTSLFVPGARQPAEVHVLAHALNLELGALGECLRFIEPAVPAGDGDQSLAELSSEMRSGKVETLFVLGGNPIYNAPAELEFADACKRVAHSFYFAEYWNETAPAMKWFAPLAHPFESWGDGRAYDGTYSIVQPLIRSLNGGETPSRILAAIAQLPVAGDHARLRAQYGARFNEELDASLSEAERNAHANPAVDRTWRALLYAGFEQGTAFPAQDPELRPDAIVQAAHAVAQSAPSEALELDFLASPTLHDGRFANVSWLLELPEPVTKLTWDNAALMSRATALSLGIADQARPGSAAHPLVELKLADRVLRLPAFVAPGHADGAVSVWLGYGRQGKERLARGVGADAYRLRTSRAPYFVSGLQLTALDERYELAITQYSRTQHERELAIVTTLDYYREHPDFTHEHKDSSPSLLLPSSGTGPQWAMTIDLTSCIGCSACMVACQAENNLLVVGKEQVRRGRVMHWLRIDSYLADEEKGDTLVHQPMACQHCEKAPCEYVCPVNATVHSADGLNEMVYNRCIGTRFCSNNCPYKVRRFNWLDWVEESEANQGLVELQRNPEVSVRERGVMEKCTYCVQRIRHAEIEARVHDRPIATRNVRTACQQVCPTEAITFGSLGDAEAPVVQLRQEPRSYAALHDTNAQPRTMYLARIENPNPELKS